MTSMTGRLKGIVVAGVLLGGAVTAMAGDMPCGAHVITDGETDGATKSEVSGKCGAPHEVNGDDWFYKGEGGETYRLHFNDDGKLESISEE